MREMKYCCWMMHEQLTAKCTQHANRAECPDALMTYNDDTHAYGIYIHDGGSSYLEVGYCPWCGKDLRPR